MLPRDSANEIVYLIADVVPIFNEICRRAVNFISTCYQLGSELVSRGLYFEHYELINRPSCCFLYFAFISLNHICVTNFKPNYFRQLFYAQLNSDVIARADNAYEIILIREKVLSLPNFLIERTDFASLLDVLHRPP